MKIFLLGYMGSGKSFIGRQLAADLDLEFIDFDEKIEQKEKLPVSEIFNKKGEIYFRKKERELLEDLLKSENSAVISLGGGTPCYGDNMELIKKTDSISSIYLKSGIDTLTKRLFSEKDSRPLISHLDDMEKLEEFVRKHLFERSFFYNQSEIIINCDSKTAEEIISEIRRKLG